MKHTGCRGGVTFSSRTCGGDGVNLESAKELLLGQLASEYEDEKPSEDVIKKIKEIGIDSYLKGCNTHLKTEDPEDSGSAPSASEQTVIYTDINSLYAEGNGDPCLTSLIPSPTPAYPLSIPTESVAIQIDSIDDLPVQGERNRGSRNVQGIAHNEAPPPYSIRWGNERSVNRHSRVSDFVEINRVRSENLTQSADAAKGAVPFVMALFCLSFLMLLCSIILYFNCSDISQLPKLMLRVEKALSKDRNTN